MKFDRLYLKSLISIAVPIMIQNLVTAALNAIDVIMIGQMGETAVASVGLANQITFLANFLIFGITSGSAVFAAQFWGKRDVPSIRRVVGAAVLMSVGGALIFSVFAVGFPNAALSIYTEDSAVIELGGRYLSIVGFSYPFLAITLSFGSILRSSGRVRIPVFCSVIAIILKTGLSYLLIFGKLGFPEMGIPGAALGTLVARIVETTLVLILTYSRRTPAAASLADLFHFQSSFWKPFLKTALPVVVNETFWSLGISVYNLIYARIGTEAVAAVNITATIESLAFVVFIGISNACGILVGNKIGAGEEQTAFTYARRTLIIATIGALLMGLVIMLFADHVLAFYRVSPEVKEYARRILLVISLTLWIRINNMTIIVGILRSGGDTRFGLILDVGTVWLVGIPMAAVGAFVFHLPVYYVYPLVMMDELTKCIIGWFRVFSRKWINNLTITGSTIEVTE
ncbi:MAG: MATE family efflux transporter [Anaerolineaceae bacterium]|nr:MATE family efflux transporter [Anaerolineaceae bacterium]